MSKASRLGPPTLNYYLVALLLGATNSWADTPDLLCQEVKAVEINPLTLKVTELKDVQTLYRFKAGKLFLSSPERSEYLYNSVTEEEFGRYRVGHKTLLFENDFAGATFVHADISDTRVTRVACSRMSVP